MGSRCLERRVRGTKRFVDVSLPQDGLLRVRRWRGKIAQRFENTASEEVCIQIRPKYQTRGSVISRI